MSSKEYRLEEIGQLALDIAAGLKPGSIVCLYGDLGAGKTTFAAHLIKAMGYLGDVTSPTFNLVHTYQCDVGIIWHFDLYRLKHKGEVYQLGIDDALNYGISIIEWPEIIDEMLPAEALKIKIDFAKNPEARYISCSNEK